MISVTTYSAALTLCLISLLCWGVWANTWKMAGKWRFELYALDFILGVTVVSLGICFTAGFFGSEITFLDNMAIIRLKQIGLPMIGGVLFSLGILLLLGAVSLAGLAVALTVSTGVAVIAGGIWTYFLKPGTNPVFLFSGMAITLGVVLLAAVAFKMIQSKKNEGLPFPPAPASKRPAIPRHHSGKALLLAVISGVFLGSFYPPLAMANTYEVEMGAYAILFLFAIGTFVSSLLFSMYFFNLPIEGNPVGISDYARSGGKQHLMGFLGGGLWVAGLTASLLAATAAKLLPGGLTSHSAGQGAVVLSIIAGLAAWGEADTAPDRARLFLWLSVPVFLIGVALVSLAPVYGR